MYNTIVAGYDESNSSKAALIESSHWIRRHGGILYIVHAVYFDAEEFGIAPTQLEKRLEAGEKICVRTKEKITAEFGINARSLLCEGEPPEVIVAMAKEKAADLVVLGTYGRKGLNRLLMGSVTSQVIADAPADVLVVKKPCTECTGVYASVLVPFDGSAHSKRALGRAISLAKAENAAITILYVIPRYEEMVGFFRTESIRKSLYAEAEKIVDRAGEMASIESVKTSSLIREGHVADEIVRIAGNGSNHDLIVMGSHGWRGVDKALMGSATERVIVNAPVPVLVVR